MSLRFIVFILIIQSCYSQDRVSLLLDSLTIVSSEKEISRISQEIASELKNKDWERSLHYIEYSLEIAKSSKSEEILADTYFATANIYYAKDALDVALEYYQKAYNYYKQSQNTTKKYTLENDLAVIYARLKNKDKALYYFRDINKHWTEKKDSILIAKSFNNMGTLYLEEDIDSSMYYYNKALHIVRRLNDNQLNAFIYANLGRCYSIKERPKLAIENFNRSIEFAKKGLEDRTVAWIYYSVSNHYLKQEISDSAIHYASKSRKLLDDIPYSFENLEAVRILYKSYLLDNDFENASKYFEAYNEIRDSLNIEEKAVNVEKLKLARNIRPRNK